MLHSKTHQIYLKFLRKYGPGEKFWPQWCARDKSLRLRELTAIGAILTQRTSWHNANIAIRNLKEAKFLSLSKVSTLSNLSRLTKLIRPAGFYQTKPKRLFDFCSFIVQQYGDLEKFRKGERGSMRDKLLSIKGIGPETADTILLYALDKPTFVVDEYTKRFVRKYGLANEFSYDFLKNFFEKSLPRSVRIYQNYHILIIVDQKGESGSKMEIM